MEVCIDGYGLNHCITVVETTYLLLNLKLECSLLYYSRLFIATSMRLFVNRINVHRCSSFLDIKINLVKEVFELIVFESLE